MSNPLWIRCRWSNDGIRFIKPNKPKRRGYIYHEYEDCYSIKWDFKKSRDIIAKPFIKKIFQPTDIMTDRRFGRR